VLEHWIGIGNRGLCIALLSSNAMQLFCENWIGCRDDNKKLIHDLSVPFWVREEVVFI